jgi:hypothetical protein
MWMATISNRSRYFVSVANNTDLYREFPYSELAAANAYLVTLKQSGFKSARLQSGLAALRQLITLAADRGGDLTQLLSGYLATKTELWCVTDSKILTVITEDRLDAKRKQYDAALANGGWLPDRSR